MDGSADASLQVATLRGGRTSDRQADATHVHVIDTRTGEQRILALEPPVLAVTGTSAACGSS